MTEENPETKPEKQSNASKEEQIHPEQIENQEEDIKEKEMSGFVKKNWSSTKRGIRNSWTNFVDDVKHPRKAMSDLVKSKSFITNSLAIVVGVIGALTAWGFEWLYVGADFLFMERLFPQMLDSFQSWKFLAIIITPIIASMITTPIIWGYNPESQGSGIPNVMESIALRDGFMRRRTPVIKMFTSVISSGGGLSVGREGPITQIGAGFSSAIARLVGLHGRNMRIVVISGLSAAIAATFNSPIGGALFGIEILLVSLVADEIVPIVIASLTASSISAIIDIARLSPNSTGIPEPSFKIELLRELDWNSFIFDLHWFILFGIVAGLIGVFYTKIFHFTRGIFARIKISRLYIPVLGALCAGLTGLISPKNAKGIPLIFGAGYTTITSILENDVTELQTQNPLNSLISFLIVLLLLKILITSFSVGSNNPGGIFAPALFIGACSGNFFATVINTGNNIDVDVSVFALAGLASVFAGATRAPLTMIFMGAEMTGNIKLMIPLMLTCSISYLVCRSFMKESIYTQSLADKGLNIKLGGHITILSQTKVRDIMTKDVSYICESAKIDDAIEMVKIKGYFGLPIVKNDMKLVGMISLSDIRMAQLENQTDETVMRYVEPNYVILTEDQSADEALEILTRYGYQRAPVVNSMEEMELIGILSKTDILRSFEIGKMMKEDYR